MGRFKNGIGLIMFDFMDIEMVKMGLAYRLSFSPTLGEVRGRVVCVAGGAVPRANRRGGAPTDPLTRPLTALSDMARHNFDDFQS